MRDHPIKGDGGVHRVPFALAHPDMRAQGRQHIHRAIRAQHLIKQAGDQSGVRMETGEIRRHQQHLIELPKHRGQAAGEGIQDGFPDQAVLCRGSQRLGDQQLLRHYRRPRP
ncbi:hypothetical protein SDC9_196651 [bioreactor metagenome]|uniref:Uncharacterized protein n=1 Tax=bioreactor metagenome TaxID=1076179 RepID=A0A645ICK1_9ZZZZ